MTQRNDMVPSDAVAVTASDTTAVNFVGLFVGTAGNVALKGEGGTSVTFKNVANGTLIYPLRITAVMSTNTTAADIVGFKP